MQCRYELPCSRPIFWGRAVACWRYLCNVPGNISHPAITLAFLVADGRSAAWQEYAERRALRAELKALRKEERQRQQRAVDEVLKVGCASGSLPCVWRSPDRVWRPLSV